MGKSLWRILQAGQTKKLRADSALGTLMTHVRLSPDNVWYGKLKLLFTISVEIDCQDEPVDLDCAYVAFCYEIKLDPLRLR